jgi:hypothetical protein
MARRRAGETDFCRTGDQTGSLRRSLLQSRWQAVLHALLITLFGCVVFGVCCFVLLANYLSQQIDRYHAVIWLQPGFSVAAALAFAFVVVWHTCSASGASRPCLWRMESTMSSASLIC